MKMKIILSAAVFGIGALASVAQAQDKKNYVIGSLGIYAVSGGKTVTETNNANAPDYTYMYEGEFSEDGNNLRLGFGTYINETLSLEFAIVNFGDIKFTDKNTHCNYGNCVTTTSESKGKLDVYDISAVYYKPLNEKANLTFRGGITSYQWVGDDGEDIKENDYVKTSSGITPLLGIGAEFGDIHVELRRYDLTYTTSDGDYYTTPFVLSVGYKARF